MSGDTFQFFEKSYIGCVNKRTQVRAKPFIAFHLWSKYEEVIGKEDITNNSAEAWNSVVKLNLNIKPNIWSLLEMFKKEEAHARSKMVKKKEKLKVAVEKYGELPLTEYLDLVGTNMNDN